MDKFFKISYMYAINLIQDFLQMFLFAALFIHAL